MRGELQLAPTAVAVAQVARFHPVKDHETCLRAWALVMEQWQQSHPPAGGSPASGGPVLLLVGDGERRSQLETLAQHLHIDHAVRFLGVRQDVSRLLTGCDVFVLSSLSEGISVTLLEAMAAGLPIAATAVGGNGEVVLDQVTGLLSPRQDPPALAQNLLRLIHDADLRQRLGAAGRARMLTHFTQDRMHRRYAELYEQMLGISPSPSGRGPG